MKSLWFVSLLVLLVTGCVSVKPRDLIRDRTYVTIEQSVTREKTHVTNDNISEVTRHASRVTLYKATLNIKKHHLTGLLIVKRMDSITTPTHATPQTGITPYPATSQTGSSGNDKVYRIVFANEFGMTFFDLELKSDSFKVVSCFESLNKKVLLKIFETDFRLLTGMDPVKPERSYIQTETNNRVISGNAGKYKIWQTYSPSGDTLYRTAVKSTIADPAIISCLKYADGIPTKITIENPFIGMKFSLRLLDWKN
jgi:hypothetical protein